MGITAQWGDTAQGHLWDTHNDEGVEQGPVERQEADDVSGSTLLRGLLQVLLQVWGGMGGGGHGSSWGRRGASALALCSHPWT